MPISSEKTKLGAATVITFWFGLPWSLLCFDWWLDNKHWVQRRFFGGFLLENYNKELLRSGFIWPCQRGHFLILPIWVCATKQTPFLGFSLIITGTLIHNWSNDRYYTFHSWETQKAMNTRSISGMLFSCWENAN